MTAELPLERQLARLVDECLDGGLSLCGRYGKTMTVDGRRRYTIRVQSDIVAALWPNAPSNPHYPDLTAAIATAVAEWRAAR